MWDGRFSCSLFRTNLKCFISLPFLSFYVTTERFLLKKKCQTFSELANMPSGTFLISQALLSRGLCNQLSHQGFLVQYFTPQDIKLA